MLCGGGLVEVVETSWIGRQASEGANVRCLSTDRSGWQNTLHRGQNTATILRKEPARARPKAGQRTPGKRSRPRQLLPEVASPADYGETSTAAERLFTRWPVLPCVTGPPRRTGIHGDIRCSIVRCFRAHHPPVSKHDLTVTRRPGPRWRASQPRLPFVKLKTVSLPHTVVTIIVTTRIEERGRWDPT